MQRKGKTEKRTGQVRVEREYTAVYKVARSDELLEFLLKKCNTSRNNVKSLLTRGQVFVNGSVVTRHDFALAKDDEVKISRTPNRVPAKERASEKRPVRLPFPILLENEDFIAIDKPCGLLSVESDKEKECAYAYVLQYLQAKDKTARPFILHRIDKETSGVLIFAKNRKLHSMLKMKWNDLVSLREYVAVVEGVFAEKTGTVRSYLKENVNNLVYSTQDKTGQLAITHYEVLKESQNYSLLRVRIDTGRKNQIRVQMRSLEHSVVGDSKYGSAKDPLKRLGLHASALSFTHPVSGERVTVTSSAPSAFFKLF